MLFAFSIQLPKSISGWIGLGGGGNVDIPFVFLNKIINACLCWYNRSNYRLLKVYLIHSRFGLVCSQLPGH